MASNSVLNIRLPEDLKKHGNQVLEREGISVSKIVRDLYKFMDEKQDVPPFAKNSTSHEKYENRRRALRNLIGTINIPNDFDVKDMKEVRIMSKYGERP